MCLHDCLLLINVGLWLGHRADKLVYHALSSWVLRGVCCAGGAGSGGETGIAGRLRALLRGRGGRPDAIKAKGITPDIIQEAAAATEGFSGRELAKLVASMQASPAPSPASVAGARTLCRGPSALPLHGGTSHPLLTCGALCSFLTRLLSSSRSINMPQVLMSAAKCTGTRWSCCVVLRRLQCMEAGMPR